MRLFYLFFFFILSFSSLNANQCKKCIILQCNPGQGMCSACDTVLKGLRFYERKRIAGLIVDFSNFGCYYSKDKGNNWWEYYFEPISIGNLRARKEISYNCEDKRIKGEVPKYEAYGLYNKYIRLKPYLNNIIEDFYNENFKSQYIIGVHYRGTDKIAEAPRTEYSKMKNFIDEEIKKNKNCKIFLATDEQQFLDYLIDLYQDKMIYVKDSIRSKDGKPVHFNYSDKFKVGMDAIVDMVLLSKCSVLIRTPSNLSRWSTYLNPDMRVILTN